VPAGEGALRAVNVAGFAGSLREGSFNRALLEAAIELAPERMTIEILDISEIPLYNADVEAQGDPEPVAVFKRS
jgi:chromate reductase